MQFRGMKPISSSLSSMVAIVLNFEGGRLLFYGDVIVLMLNKLVTEYYERLLGLG